MIAADLELAANQLPVADRIGREPAPRLLSLGRALKAAPIVILLAGGLLRIWQYAGCRSLWLDEAALANNIIHKPLSKLLFYPMDDQQYAPPGFLLLEKGATMLLG